jgi:xanthine dehydrogenase accessory factor
LPPGLAGDADILGAVQASFEGEPETALVTIVGLDGPFSRPLGAQLAVAQTGRFLGSISGGCLEAALVEEARLAMDEGKNRLLRYGEGSPYLDVRLPCGGGIDLLVTVKPEPDVIAAALAMTSRRKRFSILLDRNAPSGGLRLGGSVMPTEFERPYKPPLRLVLLGRGWEIVALCRQAGMLGFDVVVASQESATLDYCRPYASDLVQLTDPRDPPQLATDADTAVACLFHEHEWEAPLLLQALRSPAFYVGALGSRRTHTTRVDTLKAMGATDAEIARLKGPLGAFAAHDPTSIAVASLSEIIELNLGRLRTA